MKPHVADWKTRVYCARIVAVDGTTVFLTEYPVDLTMSNGNVYATESGYEFSGLDTTDDMSPSSVDLNGILNQGITRDQLASGVFDNARFYLFATSWANPVEDEEPVGLLIFGKTTLQDSSYKTEMMSLSDALKQSTGSKTSAQCQNILFDQTIDGSIIASDRSSCTGPRSSPDGPALSSFKVSGTVTAVTNQYQFQDSARPEAADWFSSGQVRFITGPNAAVKPIQVKQSQPGGQIICYEPFFYPISVGDQYEMIPGCRKRLMEDCVAKFGNAINFRGQPHMPTSSQSGAVGRGG
ncbi:DUF2163 domain-containing protein [Pseudomonas sp.]|uniref:DUF2163 domain-containing protein n=1 Tax=Pseudomonas sp. TaxID=306 RepID=UPI00290E5490|nr:DUF2163 domain-containing protein [Pseudomonas sp.]MDU4248999.1 DUF2163 domain-containing protein [Pseudomonas sp.]